MKRKFSIIQASKDDIKNIRFSAREIQFIDAKKEDGKQAGRPRFKMVAYTGGIMEVGYGHPVVVDLTGMTFGKRISIRFNHDSGRIIGHAENVEIKDKQLVAEGVISFESADAEMVVNSAKNGFKWQASIGAQVKEMQFIREKEKIEVNGQVFYGPLYAALKTRLGEISFVDLGADENTKVSVAAKQTGGTNMNIKELLKRLCGDNKNLFELLCAKAEAEKWDEEKAKAEYAAIAAGFKEEQKPPENKGAQSDFSAQRAEAAAEIQRVAAISKACVADAELAAKAIKEGWTVEKAELEILRASRPTPPAVHSSANPEASNDVLEAALVLGGRVLSDAKAVSVYGEKTIHAADKFRRAGIKDIVRMVCARRGVNLPYEVNAEWVRAAFSTNELTNILGNVANKALGQGFNSIDPVVPRIARTVSYKNFHPHTVCSLALNGELQEVGQAGELKHLSLSEETRTNQLKTRGAILALTRQDIINDDLSALTNMAAQLGRKAALSRESVIFALLNATGAGSSFFTSGNKNYKSGAGSALSIEALSAAVQLFREQTGPDGLPIMVTPRILLVAPANEETAKALMNSQFALIATALGSTAAAKKEPSANVWAGAFQPEVSPYLATGFSGRDAAWYLLADPNDLAAIEIAYLNGIEQPTIEAFGPDQDVNTLGYSWRVYWDFGGALAEKRAGVKSYGS